ncbi:hypothetical protein jhhlp_004472 [Lomentospora prolificans]|uniref:Uncharacterized protein n=1 Tax=Lomentospora prolificans TaxID=41688 RepID=A0A2N3NBP1_9PEZI|nr:hypothetical protein jhhlp_004472 [Lomentospora prolificans]
MPHMLKALDSNASTLNGTVQEDNASAMFSHQNTAGHTGNRRHNSQAEVVVTPEPRADQVVDTSQTTPSTPGLLPPFDWDDFQSRYEKALAEADECERAILNEFEYLSKVARILTMVSNVLPLLTAKLLVFPSVGISFGCPRQRAGFKAAPHSTAICNSVRREHGSKAKAL